ncbi:hypothetical protein B0H14DRAFT_3160810 [Mycena olivaceomarginata]|nr:hypothetical protein B0H14DRAFT_3160810 [Mycena olivaceomarginata]
MPTLATLVHGATRSTFRPGSRWHSELDYFSGELLAPLPHDIGQPGRHGHPCHALLLLAHRRRALRPPPATRHDGLGAARPLRAAAGVLLRRRHGRRAVHPARHHRLRRGEDDVGAPSLGAEERRRACTRHVRPTPIRVDGPRARQVDEAGTRVRGARGGVGRAAAMGGGAAQDVAGVTGELVFQDHPCGAAELLIDSLPEGAAHEAALYPDGTHLTDLMEVRDLLYTMQRPAIVPHLVYPYDWLPSVSLLAVRRRRWPAPLFLLLVAGRSVSPTMFQTPQAGLEVQLAENIDSYPSILITLTLSICPTLLALTT